MANDVVDKNVGKWKVHDGPFSSVINSKGFAAVNKMLTLEIFFT